MYVTKKNGKNVVKVLSCDNRQLLYYPAETEVGDTVILSAKLKDKAIAFFADGKLIKDNIEASILTDEHFYLGFTGAMVDINCIDCEKRDESAVFEWFEYTKAKDK